MNTEKFEKKIEKKYGVTPYELKDLKISKIKKLQNINKTKLKEEKKFKVIRSITSTITKGAAKGAAVAGTIDTLFPNIIPVIQSAITTTSKIGTVEKSLSYILASSKAVATISGWGVIGIGAGCGTVLYGSYKLIKSACKQIKIINDKHKAKKLYK